MTPPAPAVTVVVPTRNRVGLLARAVASALAQEAVPLEVVVADDASTDDTASCLRRVLDERVRVIHLAPRAGVSRARNEALGMARGEWLAFLDDDDFWAPHKLRSQLEASRAAGAVLTYARAVVLDETGVVKRVTRPAPPDELDRALLGTNTIGTPSGVLARTGAVPSIGGFDEELSTFADWDLWLRLLRHGTAAFVGDELFAYVEHAENMHATQIRSARAELRLLARKHRDLCRARGTRFGSPELSRWLLSQYRPQGPRLEAAREYARLGLRHGSPRDLGRAVGVLLGKRPMRLGRAVFGAAQGRSGDSPPPREPPWVAAALRGDAFSDTP